MLLLSSYNNKKDFNLKKDIIDEKKTWLLIHENNKYLTKSSSIWYFLVLVQIETYILIFAKIHLLNHFLFLISIHYIWYIYIWLDFFVYTKYLI